MNTIRQFSFHITTEIARSFSLLAAAALLFAALPGAATELIVLASAPQSSAAPSPSVEQELATIQVRSNYAANVRADLDAAARYPAALNSTGVHPEGKVAVLFQLDRQGNVLSADVAESSRSNILDRAALSNVRHAKFQAIPAGFDTGDDSAKFIVTYDFRFDGQK